MNTILYCGDTSLQTAASYLAGILTHYKLPFDYVPSDQPIATAVQGPSRSLYIISDYAVKNMTPADQQAILAAVRGGAGLLMIGGWESFCGLGGGYAGSAIAEALPVEISSSDDRVNSWSPCVVEKSAEHAIVAGLPLDRPPTIGGYNLVAPKSGSTVILSARHLNIRSSGPGKYTLAPGEAAPLLVVGTFGSGRAAAFTSDVAPHWVGGLVDWGDKRVKAQAPGAGDVEVGNLYAELFARIVKWAAGIL